jgi:PPK2 family polyphosphate:nucleotide phosphotransferase
MKLHEFLKPYRIDHGRKFRMKDISPKDTHGIKSKDRAQELLKGGVERLAALQDKLYAQDSWAVLLVFQAMDAAGKDGTIKHVMSGINPQGCQVFSFKQPSSEELDHDFLWRSSRCLPERGRIGIFNRSYYEEVLVVKVHPEFLDAQKLPSSLVSKDVWKERYEDINCFERYLSRNGVAIRKFFLHVSKEEQRQRFMSRLEVADKNWKFSLADIKERNRWDDYQKAYEEAIQNTATPHAPWFVVPADHKWVTRLVVAGAVIDALEELDLAYPKVDSHKRAELKLVQAELETEGAGKKGKKAKAGREAKAGKKAKGGRKGKNAKGDGDATNDGGPRTVSNADQSMPIEHPAVVTEGRGATTGTV